jgi:hypothetical protein
MDESITISTRSFNHLELIDQNVVEVGAGCNYSEVSQFLHQLGCETSLEEPLFSINRKTIGETILSGFVFSLQLWKESFDQSLIGVEFVSKDGSQIKWGGKHRGMSCDPPFHRLLPKLSNFPGILTRVYLKCYPIPPVRLKLGWSFEEKSLLWTQLERLQNFADSWERLDWVISANEEDKGFLFAQISGTVEEMQAFREYCPGLKEENLVEGLRRQTIQFLKQQSLKAFPATGQESLHQGEYLWCHAFVEKRWLLTNREIQSEERCFHEWENQFLTSFL